MWYNNKIKRVLIILLLGVLLPALPIYAARTIHRKTESEKIAERLGWVTDITPYSICPGYYVQPELQAFEQPTLPIKQSQTAIYAASGSFTKSGASVLKGPVEVVQSGRRLYADKAIYYRSAKTGKITVINLYGNVKVLEPGKLIIGNFAHLNLQANTGYVNAVYYRVLLANNNELPLHMEKIGPNKVKLCGLAAWGKANKAIQLSKAKTAFNMASYSTCPPTTRQWHVVAEKINLDKKKGRGTARNVVLYIKHIPVFYTPYLSFPLNNKRKTGFLFPVFGTSNVSGFEFAWPFYWNIAPNYDATIAPTLYSKRGVLLKGQFRYLTLYNEGRFQAGFIPNDKAFKTFKKEAPRKFPNQFGLSALLKANDNRSFFHWHDDGHYDQHWSSIVDYTHVSDDYYFQDFGSIPSLITMNQLLNQAEVNYSGQHWNFTGLAQKYDVLHAVNRQPVANVYSRLPELDLDADYPDIFHDFDFSLQNQATYFTRSRGPLFPAINPPQGGRFNFQPALSLPINRPYGFFIPTIQFLATDYSLKDQLRGRPSSILRTLPMLDINSGLYFDRNLTLGHTPYVQTLEPRIYYLYVPFRNQNNIPNFDSGIIPFSFDQLFRTNRFSGLDRIGDANQISLALITSFVNQNTGEQKFKLGVGEIYYFRNRRVTLCNTKGCSDFIDSIGATPTNQATSPIAGEVVYNFNPAWSANGNIAWNPNTQKTNNANFYFQYHPDDQHLVNFGYNFLRNGDRIVGVPVGSSKNNLSLLKASFVWPLTNQWSTIGIFSFNLSQEHPQTYLGGLEYNSCCWDFRVIGGRTFTALNENGKSVFNQGVYIQFQLKGLANIDPGNVATMLATRIPGYHDPFNYTRTFLSE